MRVSALGIQLLGVLFVLSGRAYAAAYLYRGDSRGPTTLQKGSPPGFKAWGYDKPEGTLEEHITKSLEHPMHDPFISTSHDVKIAREFAQKPHNPNRVGWVYYLDPSKIKEEMHDTAAYWAQIGGTNPYAREQEVAVNHLIPWSAVVKVERVEEGKAKLVKVPGVGTEAGPSNTGNKTPPPGDKPQTHSPEDKPQISPTGNKSTPESPKPAPANNSESKIPIPVSKPAPAIKPTSVVTNSGNKIPVSVTKPENEPKKKGGKRHARDFSYDDEATVVVDGKGERTNDAEQARRLSEETKEWFGIITEV
jgi:hypothetical protein